jgi:O-antigen/teichoic acid export membrane protein
MQMAEKLWLISQAVNTVLFPRLSEVRNNPERVVAITGIVSRVTLFVTLAGAIAAGAVAYFAIVLIFGARFSAAYVPFLLMLPGIVAGSAVRILSSEIAARGRPEINLYMGLSVVLVNIVLNLLLIPPYGINGAAVATSLAYISNLGIRLIIYRKFTGAAVMDILLVKRSDFAAARGLLRRR